MKVKSSLNVRIFDLTEFEWYGDNPETAGPRQSAMLETVMKDAYESGCKYAVIFVTPDDLFSVSPTNKRHKVFSESLSPIVGNLQVTISANIPLKKYNEANAHRREAMLKLAETDLLAMGSHVPAKGVDISYFVLGVDGSSSTILRSVTC